MQRDLYRLRKLERTAREQPTPANQAKLDGELAAARDGLTRRLGKLPKPSLDPSLPVFERAQEIASLIRQHQVVVVSGETGSGKSTQLPLIALQAGIGAYGLIGHTQPRRIAARSVAARIAQLLNSPLGDAVGFKIRFNDQTNDDTYVKLMTDGILLAETQFDRFLDRYEMLIVDEAHERSLNIDFLLGYLKNLLPKRPNLKLVITSATFDTEKFSHHFSDPQGNPAPVLHVAGRTYPVEVRYHPPEEDSTDEQRQQDIVRHCRELVNHRDGDVLVFLPTEMEIRQVTKKLRAAFRDRPVELLPLYARLSPAQQNEVFRPSAHGRVVLATNVAESSITVPGIRYVVDSGTARISRYAPRTKIQRLPIEAISQASAKQRAGRCGRVAPGICVRLYSEDDYSSRPEFTTPEIRRTNLAGTILQLLALRLGAIDEFPFIDPPSPELIRDGFKTLFEIGAIDGQRRLTPLGKKLSRLPVDPRIGRMLFAADEQGCLNEILIITSALELQDVRIRPAEKQAEADAAHRAWNDPQSDFLAILNMWDFIVHLKETLSRSRFRMALEQNFLSPTLVAQWQDIHRQLLEIVGEYGLKVHRRQNQPDAIHRSLLSGLLSSVATLEDKAEYTGAGGVKFFLWPGSGVLAAKPKWIMAAEIVETSRRYARTVAAIKPEWIEPIAGHVLQRTASDPYWSDKGQTVMALQKTTLFGLTIRSQERVNYTKIDPETSRDLFIAHGLVEGRIRSTFEFFEHNRMLMEEIEMLAKKTRQRQLVMDSTLIANFYHRRLPIAAVDVRSLTELLRLNSELSKRLEMQPEDLGISAEDWSVAEQLPDRVQVGSVEAPVQYEFHPGGDQDGANVRLPKAALGQIDEVQLGWLIPGLLKDRVIAMIRSLPKPLRRRLVPAPDIADRVLKEISFGEGNFFEVVAKTLGRIAGEPIPASHFTKEKIDPHLLVNLIVVDDQEQPLASGRSLLEIREQLGAGESTGIIEADSNEWNQTGLTEWTWESLPDQVPIVRGKTRLIVYPAIVDDGESVSLRLVESAAQAETLTHAGLARLFLIRQRKNVRSQVQWLPGIDQVQVYLARWIKSEQFKEWLGRRLVVNGLVENQDPIRSAFEFEARNRRAVELLSVATQELATWLPKLGDAAHKLALKLEEHSKKQPEVVAEIRRQSSRLLKIETLEETSWRWLQQLPRYLQGFVIRLDKLASGGGANDRAAAGILSRYDKVYEQLAEQHQRLGMDDPELDNLRWMIEEFRVSKFAQNLGTSVTVSEKRLDKQVQNVRESLPVF